jgi:IS5 family transposase
MRPRSPAEDGDEDLSRSRLASMLDPRHALLRVAALIDWAALDAAFGPLFAEAGRPGLPTRLMAGLHLLKRAKGLSDEQVCAQWVENPYFRSAPSGSRTRTSRPSAARPGSATACRSTAPR